jgi:hypothetical protein
MLKYKYNCNSCGFASNKESNYNNHIETNKHQILSYNDLDNKHKYFCSCGKDYKSRGSLHRHKKTCKHIYMYNDYQEVHICECGKEYKHQSNLYRHRKICVFIKENCDDNLDLADIKSYSNDMILTLIKQNEEIQQIMIEQQDNHYNTMKHQQELHNNDIKGLIPLIGNNNTITTNNKFNLNIFLNEDCKEAINFSEFLKDLNITDDDLDFSRSNGFVSGLCNIFVRGLKKLSQTTRPLHCTDVKRDVIYIKDNDTWDKDINNNKLIKSMDEISDKQYKYVNSTWFNKNKDEILINDNLKVKHCHYLVAVANSATNNKYRQALLNNIKRIINVDKT